MAGLDESLGQLSLKIDQLISQCERRMKTDTKRQIDLYLKKAVASKQGPARGGGAPGGHSHSGGGAGPCVGGIRASGHAKPTGPRKNNQTSTSSSKPTSLNVGMSTAEKADTLSENSQNLRVPQKSGTINVNDTNIQKNNTLHMDIVKEEPHDQHGSLN